MAAVVAERRSIDGSTAAFTAVGREQGATRIAVPAFRRRHGPGQISTGVMLMNMGPTRARVVVAALADVGTLGGIRCDVDFHACIDVAPGDSVPLPPPERGMTAQSPQPGIGSVLVASTEPLAVGA